MLKSFLASPVILFSSMLKSFENFVIILPKGVISKYKFMDALLIAIIISLCNFLVKVKNISSSGKDFFQPRTALPMMRDVYYSVFA